MVDREAGEQVGNQKRYGVVMDPTADEEEFYAKADDSGARRSIRRRCAMGTLFLAFMYFSTYSMYNDLDCRHGTTSGQPFRLIHQIPGRYGCSMLLATFATVTAMFYPIAVARRARPHFLHVAGCYLVVNAITICCEVQTVWAGCADVEWIRAPTAGVSMLGLAISFVLLQYSILVKVEALDVDSREEDLAKQPLRRAYHMMLNPFTIGFGLLSSVVPMGLVGSHGFLYMSIIFVQAFFLVIFLGVMLSFTAIAVKQMRVVLHDLDSAQLDRQKKQKLKSHLAMHSVATLMANMTTMLFFGSIVLTVMSGGNSWQTKSESFMLFCYGLDNFANNLCALVLSGLTGAVCRKGGGVALLDDDADPVEALSQPAGPVQQLQAAGHAVQKGKDEERAGLQEDSGTEEAE